ncbi:MAG: hypothetical protein ACTS7D_00085 [Candidatus Hodgkinia cicadicola]
MFISILSSNIHGLLLSKLLNVTSVGVASNENVDLLVEGEWFSFLIRKVT